MIVPMKKVTLMVQESDSRKALGTLRSLGVLHVEHENIPQGKEINTLNEEISFLTQAINILSSLPITKDRLNAQAQELHDWKLLASHIIDSYKRLDQLKEHSQTLLNRISEWQDWGDFDPESISSFARKNIFLKLYQIPVKELKNLPSDLYVKKISEKRGLANCAVIALKAIDLPFREVVLAKMSLSNMYACLQEDNRVTAEINKDLEKQAVHLESFLKTKEVLLKELEFNRTLKGMGNVGTISYISGYLPQDALRLIEETALSQAWGFFSRDPEEGEEVPTLLRNPRFISLIKPVFKLLEIVPGYRELDISPLFLFFLSLFFGMIISDAGYGAIYFLLTFFIQRKLKTHIKDQRIFYLLYLFSSCAIVWGLLTGTVFGQEWYSKAGHQAFLPFLNNTKFLQAFCFFLGAIHLSLGHAWQAARKFPAPVALSDMGWISILWAAFFAAKSLILDDPFPFFGKWLIIGGLALVIFFSHPQKNIVKTALSGLGTVALNLMNNFTDVVSYIRLFAIGLAGVAIADTINTLAAGLPDSAFLGKVLIVFIGHTINMVLGIMSVLVHGVRLNVLEFSAHAGLSWSGTAYKPLKS